MFRQLSHQDLRWLAALVLLLTAGQGILGAAGAEAFKGKRVVMVGAWTLEGDGHSLVLEQTMVRCLKAAGAEILKPADMKNADIVLTGRMALPLAQPAKDDPMAQFVYQKAMAELRQSEALLPEVEKAGKRIVREEEAVTLVLGSPEEIKRQMDATGEEMRRSWDRRIPAIRFNKTGLAEAIDFIRDVSALPIYVDWEELKTAGVEKTSAVTLTLRDVPAMEVIRLLLNEVRPQKGELVAVFDDGVLNIAMRATLERKAAEAEAETRRQAELAKQPRLEVDAQLARRLPEIRFNDVKLDDVFNFSRDISGASLYVDWRDLEAADIKRDTPVSMRARDLPLGDLLVLATYAAGGAVSEDKAVSCAMGNGVIRIARVETLRKAGLKPRWPLFKEIPAAEARKVLGRRVESMNFDQVTLDDAIVFIRDVSGLSIWVDWQTLDAAGIKRNARISLRLGAVEAGTAIKATLDALKESKAKAGFVTTDSNLVLIAPTETLRKLTGPVAIPAAAKGTTSAAPADTPPASRAGNAAAAALMKMADLYRVNGLEAKAKEKYAEIIARFPDTTEARTAKEKLDTLK